MSFLNLLELSILVAIVAYDVTNTKVFEWLRVGVAKLVLGTRLHKVADLVDCHYCFSHWATFGALIVSRMKLNVTGTPLDWVITWAVVVYTAQPLMLSIDWGIDAMNSFFKLFPVKAEARDKVEQIPVEELAKALEK